MPCKIMTAFLWLKDFWDMLIVEKHELFGQNGHPHKGNTIRLYVSPVDIDSLACQIGKD